MAINRVIAKTGIKRKKGYLYYIDRNGDVREAMMAQYKKDWSRYTSDTMDGLSGTRSRKKTTTKRKSTGTSKSKRSTQVRF